MAWPTIGSFPTSLVGSRALFRSEASMASACAAVSRIAGEPAMCLRASAARSAYWSALASSLEAYLARPALVAPLAAEAIFWNGLTFTAAQIAAPAAWARSSTDWERLASCSAWW